MTGEIEMLKAQLCNTDLEQYAEDEPKLRFALLCAENDIIQRRSSESFEEKYAMNKIQGAIWYLSRIGAEGAQSVSENGVSIAWEEVPSWLRAIVPRPGEVR